MEIKQKPTRARYFLIAILFFHTINTYMDRACISSAAESIQADLDITKQMMGYIFGIFAIGYALLQVPSGWMADTYGPRKLLTGVVALWSFFTMLTGAAKNAVHLLIIRFLFGAGEAGAFPGATRGLYSWVTAKERGIAQGLFHSGARVGAALSLLIMPFLIDWVGWRWTFVINGVIGIVWVAFWLPWFRDDPKDHSWVNEAELEHIQSGIVQEDVSSQKLPFGQIVTSGNMLLAMFQYIAGNITFFISFSWFQPYLSDHYGDAVRPLAAIPLIFGMFAHWTAGGLVTYLYGKGYHIASRRAPAMIGFAIGAIGLMIATQASSGTALLFVLCFSIGVFGVEMTIAPSWSFCMDIGGSRSGAVSGSMNMLGNLGSAFSAIIFPYFVANITIPYFAPETDTANSFFVFAATINALAFVAWVFMNPKKKLGSISQKQVRLRLTLFFGFAVALIVALWIWKTFYMPKPEDEMLTKKEFVVAQQRAVAMIRESGILVTEEEAEKVEIADFGLGNLEVEGAQILTFVATDRIAVKAIALFPRQTLPEHWHPRVGDDPGKEETIRVVWGTAYLYLPGDDTLKAGFIPEGKESCYSVRHELVLSAGDQITLEPGTKHWLQAGDEGAVAYSLSTIARDVLDLFTDPNIKRVTEVRD